MVLASPILPEQLLKTANALPPGMRVLAEAHELLQDANAEGEAITSLLEMDVALTARLIRMANSIVFRRGDSVGTLEEAVFRVGFKMIHELVGLTGAAEVFELPLKFYPLSPVRLQDNALLTALLMTELAPGIGENPRLAYTAGLLSSLGKSVLDLTAQAGPHTVLPPLDETTSLSTWEEEVFGQTSTAAGALILRTWRFPPEVFVAVRDHRMEHLSVEPMPIAKLLCVAAAAVSGHGFGLRGEQIIWERHAAQAQEGLGLDADQVAGALERAVARFTEMKASLG